MEPVLGEGEPEGLGHLALRLPPRPGVGHREAKGDAVGGKEDVGSLLPACGLYRPVHVCPHCRVEVEGEACVPSDEGLEVRRGSLRGRIPGRASQHPDLKGRSADHLLHAPVVTLVLRWVTVTAYGPAGSSPRGTKIDHGVGPRVQPIAGLSVARTMCFPAMRTSDSLGTHESGHVPDTTSTIAEPSIGCSGKIRTSTVPAWPAAAMPSIKTPKAPIRRATLRL